MRTRIEEKQKEIIEFYETRFNSSDDKDYISEAKLKAELTTLESLDKGIAEDVIEDGLGSSWSVICPMCGKKSMQIVRPGKVQCKYCG